MNNRYLLYILLIRTGKKQHVGITALPLPGKQRGWNDCGCSRPYQTSLNLHCVSYP